MKELSELRAWLAEQGAKRRLNAIADELKDVVSRRTIQRILNDATYCPRVDTFEAIASVMRRDGESQNAGKALLPSDVGTNSEAASVEAA